MTDITFHTPTLEDREWVNRYLELQNSRNCEFTFANMYLWRRQYPAGIGVVGDMLVVKTEGATQTFSFPIGRKENIKQSMDLLMEYSKEHGIPFQMHLVTPEQFEILDELYPGKFKIEYDRDMADYIYETEKLANLSGRKYHGKKNHINKFMRLYPDWKYESLNEQNVEDCFQMALEWRNQNGCNDHEEKNAEMCVSLNSLRLFRELHLRGGLLRVGGKVVAFSIGEPVTKDTMVVHIEKAFADIEGAYTMINQQFVQHEAMDYQYVNREEDTGEEGLRQAKLSYHPAILLEKGLVQEKQPE
ncbi:MAG: phosphatidylglycerol lysyltransferase domain-containing protein [Lachnospiraceae bacterium]|nr:phosphatidylglycerol lysyltransferase domain-containing protein [Robinsoniella sp.]MDY3767799.1 phosphatidylglycerol lysyltransferase domain-containing protein [Lachnospiraceae bacterium]